MQTTTPRAALVRHLSREFTRLALAAAATTLLAAAAVPAQAGQCPADQVMAHPLPDAPTMPVGITDTELAPIDLSKENVKLDQRRLRMRHMTIAPGGIVPMLGGWTAGRFKATRLQAATVLRCFGGGLLMGWGSLLIPGGNDGLILVGMPLLWPYAWVGFGTMCVVIASALSVQRWRPFRHPVPKTLGAPWIGLPACAGKRTRASPQRQAPLQSAPRSGQMRNSVPPSFCPPNEFAP